MTRIGAHVKTGSRNGYGQFCEAQPAIVVAVGEGGAVKEAIEKSMGHTWGVYRPTIYNNHPEGLGLNDPATTKEEVYAIADMFWPLLREDFEANPANYYIVLNESGANDPTVIKNYVWYEWRCMELAEVDGYKLCLGNLFSGAPDDGSVAGNPPNGGMEVWKTEYGPLLARGYEGGHIYGRHVYGYPDLVPLDFNSDRPFREIEWLRSQGNYIGVALTECGLHGGEFQPSEQTIVLQMSFYDAAMQLYANSIIGAAWWTYGDWKGVGGDVNLESVSPAISAYVYANPSPKWRPTSYVPPNDGYKAIVVKVPQETTDNEWDEISRYARKFKHDMTASHDTMLTIMRAGNPESFVKMFEPDRPSQVESIAFLEAEGFTWEPHYLEQIPPPSTEFRYEVWPVENDPHVTQLWAADKAYYSQFCDGNGLCLPGHGGVDMRAIQRTRIVAVAAGRVARVHLDEGTHNFGIHVYIQHVDGELTGYAHLLSTNLIPGQEVEAGQLVGLADNTGNSFGDHLHFLRKRPGETYVDQYGTWPYNLADPTPLLKPLAPHLFPDDPPPPPTGELFDLLPYFNVDEPRGLLYEVQTEIGDETTWSPGPQQRHQTHNEGGIFYHTKGGDGEAKPAEWEQLMADLHNIYRSIDTSPADDQSEYYELRDDPATKWSVWCPRFMREGQSYQRYPYVNFYKKMGCVPVSDGRQLSLLLLEGVHEKWTFFTGIALTNVIRMLWTDLDGKPIERYYYAKGYGLVGWEGRNRRAAIGEIHEPGARPNNLREVIDCID